ncbi:MAG TPA: hypothetical protein PKD90_16155, partial [Phnomibacter sp.]|nr:hypothetical protein [Phnomibacter sp.]
LVRFDRFVDAAIPLTNQGKYAEAIDLLDKALAIKPQDFRAQYERNRALTLKGGGTPPAPAQSTANANATSKPAVETPVPDTPPVQPAAQLMEVQKNTNITAIPLPSSTSSNPHEQVNTKNGMAGTKADTDPDKGPAANQPNATLTGQRVAATEEAVTPAPLSPMAMEQQSLAIPYDSVQMAQRFDGINLLNQPSGQRFTTDYYRPADSLNNYKPCQQLLPVPANTFIVDTVEADRIGATLSLVHFGAQNAFFRIDIRNHGATEYVAGEVSMHFEKADGTIVPYAPCYITGFPIVLPNHQYSLMLAARIGAPADEDKFVITLNERLKKTKLNFTIRAELYNKLLDNGNLP